MSMLLCDRCHPKLKQCQGVHSGKTTFGLCDGCGKPKNCMDCEPNLKGIRQANLDMYRSVKKVEYPRKKTVI